MARRSDTPAASREQQLHALVADAIASCVPGQAIDELLGANTPGAAFITRLAEAYESLTRQEKASAAFPFIDAELDLELPGPCACESLQEARWSVSFDEKSRIYTCKTSFFLESAEDYVFDISVSKPELSGFYIVNKLSVCGTDIYHKAYSEMAGAFVDEYPVIATERFSELLPQLQSEVDKTIDGRYDETVLEEFWESKAEEEFDSLVELYGLA